MEKIWKDVDGFEGLYLVSSDGDIKSIARTVITKNNKKLKVVEKLRKLTKTTAGYPYVILTRDDIRKTLLVHRLVAKAFIENPNNLKCVNHKDEDKANSNVNNLEWCSYTYNNTYKDIHLRRNLDSINRMVIQYDLKMNEIKRWNSLTEAGNTFKIQIANIIKCCKYERTHCAGYKWRYYE